MRPAAEEARAVHHVGVAALERLEQHPVLGGVVLEVGVLHDHVLAVHDRERGAQGGALASVDLVAQHADPRVARRHGAAGEHVRRAVVRPVVDQHDSAIHGDASTRSSSVSTVPASLKQGTATDRQGRGVHGERHWQRCARRRHGIAPKAP